MRSDDDVSDDAPQGSDGSDIERGQDSDRDWRHHWPWDPEVRVMEEDFTRELDEFFN